MIFDDDDYEKKKKCVFFSFLFYDGTLLLLLHSLSEGGSPKYRVVKVKENLLFSMNFFSPFGRFYKASKAFTGVGDDIDGDGKCSQIFKFLNFFFLMKISSSPKCKCTSRLYIHHINLLFLITMMTIQKFLCCCLVWSGPYVLLEAAGLRAE